jgi:predicted transcriptional regulator
MKTASFPSLRVDPELRQAAEQSLQDGETISSFVEQAIRDSIARRQQQKEFLARGMAAREEAHRGGDFVSADAVMQRLEGMLAKAKEHK